MMRYRATHESIRAVVLIGDRGAECWLPAGEYTTDGNIELVPPCRDGELRDGVRLLSAPGTGRTRGTAYLVHPGAMARLTPA